MFVNDTKIRVRYADTDKMGIVYYARYLEWFERGRTEMLREAGIPYKNLEQEGFLLPVIEAYVKYKKSAKYDDIVIVRTILKEVPKARITLYYEIYVEGDEEMIAEGYTVHGFINSLGKPTRAPEIFLNAVEKYFKNI